jgi:hypothetical protein
MYWTNSPMGSAALASARDLESIVNEKLSNLGEQPSDEVSDYARSAADTLAKREAEVAEADREVTNRFDAISRLMQEHLEGQAANDA